MKNIKFTAASGKQFVYEGIKNLEVQDVPMYKISMQWDDMSITHYTMSFTEITSEIPKMLINKNILTFTVNKI